MKIKDKTKKTKISTSAIDAIEPSAQGILDSSRESLLTTKKPLSQMTALERREYFRIKKWESRKRLELNPTKKELLRESERIRSRNNYIRASSTPEGRQQLRDGTRERVRRHRAKLHSAEA